MIGTDTGLWSAPTDSAEQLVQLKAGDAFAMLDNSLGWAWGYAGAEGRVGYVRAEAVTAKS